MLTLVLGPSNTGKTSYLYQQIQKQINKGVKHLVLLVPEQYSHAAERELTACLGARANLHIEVLSFKRLSSRVEAELGGSARKSLDEGGRILCMRLALDAVHSQLRLYKSQSRKTEFLTGLLKTLDELKQNAIDAEQLLDLANWVDGNLHDKLHDLAYLSGAYERISKRLDPRDRLTKLADQITNSQFTKSHFFIDGFSDFTAQESNILRKLLRHGASIHLALTCGGLDDQSHIFRPATETARFFKRFTESLGKQVSVITNKTQSVRPMALCQIEKHLFSDLPATLLADASTDGLTLFTAQNPLEECMQAAAFVRHLLMTKGYRYKDIAVAVRGFTDYESLLASAFSYYDIPCHISQKVNLLDKPIMQVLTGAFDILESNFTYEATFRYLRTGLLQISQDEVDLLEGYVKQYNLKGTRFTQKTAWREHPTQFGKPFSETDTATLAHINHLRELVLAPLLALQTQTKQEKSAKAQAFALYSFLEAIALPETLTEKAAQFRASGRETLAAEYLQIWDIFVSALEQAEGILGDSPMEFSEFSKLLRLCLSQYEIGTIPQTIDRVHLGDLDAVRRRDLKCLIVLGATDARLPCPNTASGVFTEFERQWLSDNSMPLSGTAEESVYMEYALMYHAFSLPKELLILSFPKQAAGGEENRKSPILHRLEALLDLKETSFDLTLSYLAPKPAFDLALEQAPKDETLFAMAKEYFANDETQNALEKQILGIKEQLSPEKTAFLYGSPLLLSPTRLAQFSTCPFRFFMAYGLKAKLAKKVDLDAPMEGNFTHYLLEKVSRDIMNQGGFHTKDIDLEALTKTHIAQYKEEHLGGLSSQSERFHYLFEQLSNNSLSIVSDMAAELSTSSFAPLDFELSFGQNAKLPPVSFPLENDTLLLQGAVDRVDGWVHDDKLYLRVIDYKTGYAKFSLSDVWHGHGMQMLLYLFALEKSGKDFFGGLPISPAGVLYAPAKEVILPLSKQTPDFEISKKREKEKMRSGFLLHDDTMIHAMENSTEPKYIPVKFSKDGLALASASGLLLNETELAQVKTHVEEKVIRLASEIKSGTLAPFPHTGSIKIPCDTCDFRLACHYDKKVHGVHYLPKLSRDEIFHHTTEKGDD